MKEVMVLQRTNLYMIQSSFLYGNSLYLPYAVGAIAANAFSEEEIKQNYELKKIIFLRDPIEETVKSFEEPFVAAFSCYIWNYEYNKVLAKRLREVYPDCKIIFGGHNIRPDKKMADELRFVDYFLFGEGEESFAMLLKDIAKDVLPEDVPGLIFKDGEETLLNESVPVCRTDYPSPYLSGVFDEIIKDKRFKFSAILETNRGCPYKCAFCDWGSQKSKIREFPLDRALKEIEWMAKNGIEYCYCADSNFGLFDRDLEIIDYAISLNKEYGCPQKFRVNYAKNSNDAVFEINRRLHEAGMNKGVTISFQSLTPAVLANIGRKNITLNRFSELMYRYEDAGIPTYSEIIFGMPGETYESFKESAEQLFEAGQHDSMFVYNCELLVNSEMGDPDYMAKHRIETSKIPFVQDHCEQTEEEVSEYSNIIVSTESMTKDEWIETRYFSLCIQALHCLGMLQKIAIYLFREKNVRYVDFYEKLISYLEKDKESVCGKILSDLKQKLTSFVNGDTPWVTFFDDAGDIAWPLEEALFLQLVRNFDDVHKQIEPFIRSFSVESDLCNELLRYQKEVLKRPFANTEKLSLCYDLISYFKNEKLVRKPVTVTFADKDRFDSFEAYAREAVWFGRRNGKMTRNISNVSYE